MKNLGKLWTGAVAYVSLLVGAGLSVAGNLADTDRVRGAAADAVDIVLAVGPPLATLLVAELFVSEWPRRISVQSVRWVTTAVVGTLATVVSWLHIHELLVARGQQDLVSILWPIAIDGLAIMAMAKLLVVRMSHVQDSGTRTPRRLSRRTADTDTLSPVPLDTDTLVSLDNLDNWMSGLSDRMGQVDSIPAVPVDTATAVPAVRGTRAVRPAAPDSLDTDVLDMLSQGVSPADIKRELAVKHGVSTKTVGRRFPKTA